MEKHLKLIFTSDSHGYLYPTNYVDKGEAKLGLMRLCTGFEPDEDTLILDGGDTLQGSPMTNLFYRMSKEEQRALLPVHPFAAMMNLAGYQYVTLGNHDFNHGVEALGDYLNGLNAKCLCCNIRDKAQKLPIAPYAVHTMPNGLRVGLVGACTDYVRFWEDPATVAEMDIREPVEACREALKEVKPLCDVTVLMYHGGFECSLEDGRLLTDSTENQANRICNELDFDIVLTGHQHVSVSCRKIGNSYAAQPAYRAAEACRIDVWADPEKQAPLKVEGGTIRADGKICGEAAELIRPLQDRTESWLDTPAGHLDCPLDVEDHVAMAVNGSPLANFINTVQLACSGAQISSNALANEVKGLPEDVTIRNVMAAYIYSNTLVVLDMLVTDLKKYMERCAAYFTKENDGTLRVSDDFLYPKVQHYNYDFFSGIDYTFDVRRRTGDRVTAMTIGGRQLRDDEHVSVCINSYRFNGTGGYEMLPGQKVLRDIQADVADAIIDYLMKHPEIHVDRHKYCTVIS